MQVCELEELRREVEELIKARREEARRLGIYDMAWQVARRLGMEKPKKHGSYWIFERDGLRIVWDDYAPNLSIYYGGQRVFHVHLGDVEAYRPDVEGWLELLRRIYEAEVVPSRLAEKKRELEEYLKEIEQRWGIKPEEVAT